MFSFHSFEALLVKWEQKNDQIEVEFIGTAVLSRIQWSKKTFRRNIVLGGYTGL